jgi:hypothetical protein
MAANANPVSQTAAECGDRAAIPAASMWPAPAAPQSNAMLDDFMKTLRATADKLCPNMDAAWYQHLVL